VVFSFFHHQNMENPKISKKKKNPKIHAD